MYWTDDAIDRFDERFMGDRNASEVFLCGMKAQSIAERNGRRYVNPDDVDKAIELCWK